MIKPTSFIGFIVSKIAKSYKPKHVLVRLVLSFIFATSLLATTSLSSAYASTAITRFFSDISSTLVSKVYAYNYDYWDDSSYISFEGTPGSFWVNAISNSGINVYYSKPQAYLYVNGQNVSEVPVTCNPDVGALFPVGYTTVTCSAYDYYAGQEYETSFTIQVVLLKDTTAPTISLLGSSSVTVSVGGSYTDAGATASDNVDGNITSRISVSGSVNTSVPGTYTLTYRVSDNAGNAATPVTRTVTVVDGTAPTISLLGSSSVTVSVGGSYTDAGATASDNVDGNITSRISVSGSVNTSVPGTYTLTYRVSDNAGNAATPVTRTVTVVDGTAPTISLLGSSSVTVSVGGSYTDAGATASDNVDGNITSRISVSGSVNTSVPGTYTLTYRVSDNAGNAATPVTRTVTVVDGTAPVITLTGSDPDFVYQGGTYVDPGATALDAVDGVRPVTVVSSTINSSVIGTYTITYSSSDLSGNTVTVIRTVNVIPVPTFNIVATSGVNGSVTPTGTTVVASGTSQTYTITPDAGYDVATLTVDGTSTATTTSYTFSNVTANHTIDATFVLLPVGTSSPDTIAPTVPTSLIATTTATTTGFSTIVTSWLPSTDNVAVSGYSYVWDHNASATPDAIIENTSATSTTILTDGTWYFHVITVDTSLNVSSVANYGPVVLTTVATDTTPPTGPITVTSGTHTVSATTSLQTVTVNWDAATDDTSLLGYSYVWDASPATTPDTAVETSGLTVTSFLPNGAWYFHVIAVDVSGNTSTSTVTFGPVIIDVATTSDITPPVGPTIVTSSSHTVNATSSNHMVSFAWDDATDETALAGYSFMVDTNASGTVDAIADTTATTTAYLLPDGVWYFHVASVDTSSNLSSPVVTFGPIVISSVIPPSDTVAPTDPVLTFVKNSTSTLQATWIPSTDNVALAGYATLVSVSATATPSSIVNTTATGTTFGVPDGIWYFHVKALDTSLNSSNVITSGPLTVDTHPPVITLNGSSSIALATGTPFVDPGYIATDAIDGVITGSVVASGTVDTNTVGTYVITYTITDALGNAAIPVTRTVHVLSSPDVTPPVITLNGLSTINLFVGSSYTELGATANDAVDGNVTMYIGTSGSVNTAATGTYFVTYSVSDSSGNATSSVRTVNVVPIVYHAITATVIGQGTVTPAGVTNVVEGLNQSYTFTSNFGYELSDILIDGTSTATSSSYTFSNVIASHTITAVFTALPGRPSFTVVTSATGTGSISPNGTSTVFQGDDLVVTITPTAGYYIGSLIVDSVSTATTTTYTFTNVNASHTIDATFVAYPPDTITPANVVASSPTHSPGSPTSATSFTANWTASSDAGSGLAGYSFVIDNATSTMPDTIVDATGTTVTQTLGQNTWYFHVVAVDNVGNSSSVAHYGPIVITDGTVTLTNVSLDGTFYASYAPTAASSTALGLTGTTTIINSSLVSPFTVNSSNLSNVNATSTTFDHVGASNSSFINSSFTNCTITNSFLKNYTGTNCTVSDSILDPVGVTNDISGSTISGFSQVWVSDVLNSTVSNHSYIATSTITGSTINNSTTTLSTVASSTFVGASIDLAHVVLSTITSGIFANSTATSSTVIGGSVTGSTLNNVLLTNSTSTGSTLASSTLYSATVLNSTTTGLSVNPSATNVVITNAVLTGTTILGTSTTITNSSVGNTTIQDAVITNNVIQSGIITLPSGSTTVVVTPTSVAQLINLPPVVSFVAVVSGGLVTVTDSSTDANATTSPYLSDSWTYTINYGDGVTVTLPTSSLGGSFNHTYTSSGAYTVTTTITDAYGAVTTKSTVITVTVPIISGGGGGGGYYTGGYFVTTPELTSTSSTAHLNTTNATGTVKAYTFNRSLTVGSKGSDVVALQEILRYYGFFSYPVSTGYYGPITKEAVAKFQKVYSISPVSGTVGPKTREILKLLQIPQEILKKLVEYTYEKPSISTGVLLKQTNENPQLINAVKTDKEKPSVIKRVINLFNNLFGK